jgi:hypothetical protein
MNPVENWFADPQTAKVTTAGSSNLPGCLEFKSCSAVFSGGVVLIEGGSLDFEEQVGQTSQDSSSY